MNLKGRTTIDVGADGVAVITIINPPVNSLSLDGTFSLLDLMKFSSSICGFSFHLLSYFQAVN